MAAIHLRNKKTSPVCPNWIRFLEQTGDVGLAIPASLHCRRQGSLLVRGWSNKKNQTLQENGREALEPSAAQERQLTLVSWWIDRFAHTKMLPCCWNGARIFSNICSKNGPAIAASMPHPHCMEHMGRHRAIQGFMVGSSHSALHKATILKYAPLLDKPTGLHLFPNNCYIYI